MSVYPGAADDLPTTKTDFTGTGEPPTSAVLTASEVNLIGSAVEAVQGELGLNPSGTAATVAARLDAVDTALGGKLATTGTAANAAAVGGITVTGTPTTGQVLKATSASAATWQTDATGGVGGGSVTIDADGTISDGTTTIEVALDADVAALSASTTSALAGKLSTAAGAVGTANLADGSVTAAKVAADVATQAELDAVAAAKANTSHTHSAADLTSGTLPLTRGGTGGTDAATARTSLGLGPAAVESPATLASNAAFTATYAPLASPALTGNPTAPTPSPGDNDTSIATTAFVAAAVAAGGSGGGVGSTLYLAATYR